MTWHLVLVWLGALPVAVVIEAVVARLLGMVD